MTPSLRASVMLLALACATSFVRAGGNAGPETITVWSMGTEGTKIPELAREFEAAHPGKHVITEAIPWNGAHDRLVTSIAGAVAPDVTQLGTTWVPEFGAMGALEPLDERIAHSTALTRDAWFPASLSTAVFNNRLVSLPWYVDVRLFFYRSDLLAEAGWTEFPKTWDELEKMCAAVTKDRDGDGRTDQFALSLSPVDEATVLSFIWGAGGQLLSPDGKQVTLAQSPKAAEGLAFFQSLFARGYSLKAEGAQLDPVQSFRNGTFAATIFGPWMVGVFNERLPELKGKWKVAMLPARESRTAYLGGCNLAVMRGTKNPELAWQFIEWLQRPEIQVRWNTLTGNLPAVKAAWDAPQLAAEPWPTFRAQVADSRPPPPVETWEPMAETMKNHVAVLAYGNGNADATVREISADWERDLAKRRTEPGNLALPRVLSSLGIGAAILVAALAVAAYLNMRRFHLKQARTSARVPRVLLWPPLAHLSVFVALPIIASLLLSFTNYDIYSLGDWKKTSAVGVQNYADLLRDPLFLKSLGNTFYFVVVAGPLTIAAALSCALLLHGSPTRLLALFRTGYFLPVIAPLVGVALVWKFLYAPRLGLLNWFLVRVGVAPQTWLADEHLAMPSLIIMAIWKNFGYGMVIFLAGLLAIPRELYEASEIDGAGRLQKFRNVTLPLLRPTTVFVTIITTIGFMQFFAEPFMMTDGGGPQNATLSVVLYLYKQGFRFYNLGYASAMAYLLCALIAVLSLGQLRLGRASEAAA